MFLPSMYCVHQQCMHSKEHNYDKTNVIIATWKIIAIAHQEKVSSCHGWLVIMEIWCSIDIYSVTQHASYPSFYINVYVMLAGLFYYI